MQGVPRNTITDIEVRKRIDRLLSTPMTDAEWELLEDDGYLEDIRRAVESDEAGVIIGEHVQAAAVRLRRTRHVYEGAPRSQPQTLASVDLLSTAMSGRKLARRVALSVAIGKLAADDVDVAAFVKEVLGGRPLTAPQRGKERIDTAVWIEREWNRERLSQEIDEDDQRLPLLRYAPLPVEDTSGRLRALPIRTLPVVPGGTLDRLRLLAERLSTRYGWEPAGTINFILADATPSVSTLRARVDWHEDISALTRIILIVDPAKTPEQVANAYRRVRKKVVRVFPRTIDAKSQMLALLTLKPPEYKSLEDLMGRWNSLFFEPKEKPAEDSPYRNWWYDDPQQFGRDRRRAIQRLLHPKYRSPTDDEIDLEDDLTDDADADADADDDHAEDTAEEKDD
jgi:hypothetical protein